jgi:phosphoribosylformylglycinamidine synthase
MLVLRGAPALSDFRRDKLVRRLHEECDIDARLSARFFHFVDTERPPTEAEQAVLERLLSYGPTHDVGDDPAGQLFLVVPRPGTVSPWSSKATEIAHNCGLQKLRRIERGIAYVVDGVTAATSDAVAALLHDRMTEAVLADFDAAEVLFAQAEPRPFTTVDVLAGGEPALRMANGELGLALSDDEIDLPRRELHRAGPQPDRCRADDVRAGELRALPAQDLQRAVEHRRRGRGSLPVRR